MHLDHHVRKKLEGIIWPHVKTMLKERIDGVREDWMQGKAEGDVPVVVLEAAVLLDAGWDDVLDGVWVVTAPKAVALQRLIETRGLSKEEAEKRMGFQASTRGIGNLKEEVDNGVVTAVIENMGSSDDLKQALEVALKNPQSWK
jgi:dephospho-CoA kinase